MSSEALDGSYPLKRAWYAVVILMILYAMSYVDRMILALLAPAVGEYLHISDTQLGILFGLGFGVVYALSGLPLAHLIDRNRRVPLVAGGVVLWSLCTALSGFAPSFTTLLILRAGVAIGEAVLSPAAISIIADAFPRDKRSLPTTLYTAVATVMGAGSFIIGGAALQLSTHLSHTLEMEPWQITLVLVAAPGLLLAPLFIATVREPPRTGEAKSEQFETLRAALAYVFRERMLYGCILTAAATVGMATCAKIAWTPTLLVRGYSMQAATAGYLYGTIGLVAGTAGVAVWPAIARAWAARGRRDALITTTIICLTASWICLAVVGLTRSQSVLLVAAGFSNFFGAAITVLMPWLFQMVTPGRVLARVMAMYLFAAALIGLTVGPPLAATLSEAFFDGPFAIGMGMGALVLAVGPMATVALCFARKPYLRALTAAEAREARPGDTVQLGPT